MILGRSRPVPSSKPFSGAADIRDIPASSRRTVLGALAMFPLASAGAAAKAPSPPGTAASGIATVTPEQFGAIGDGVADDAPAIQRAIDALAARGPHGPGGTVVLQPKVAYRCASGLVLDATHVSLWGNALLDFSTWEGRYLRISASSVADGKGPENNYGHKGMISGALRLKGAGQATRSIGIDFDSPNVATAAQMLVENMAVFACGTGVRFGERAYNSLLLHCEIFNCGICIDWPAMADNGERNTLVSCKLYNSSLAIRVALGSASLQLFGCSLDYTGRLYEVSAGSVLATSCHHESSVWEDRPIRCSGNGSFIRLDGGWIVHQGADWPAHSLVDVGQGSAVHLSAMIVNNIALTAVDATRPASWAIGDGECRLTNTQSFDFSIIPIRLQAGRTQLSDPDFRSAAWEDRIWRTRDTAPTITGRYGAGSDNLKLTKASIAGEHGLVAAKAYGSTSNAAFVLIAMPVRYGEIVLAGFRVRRDPMRPGTDGTLFVSPTWARLDGEDQSGVPIMVRADPIGTQTVIPPTDRFLLVSPTTSRAQRTAPSWATHFCMVVDLVKAHQASFVFNGLWYDLI